ncbi:MAG: PAS domain S-box protein [gamma proteobacterium symbiont of Taylorina sp.]|nr:PAS domain S-box protein [gamma proteobacterium symbiont of Taylorina sp.]
MSFKNNLLIGFIIYGIVLISIVIFSIYNINKSNLEITNIDNAVQKYKEKKAFFNYQIKYIELKLKALKVSELFQRYIDTGIDEHIHMKDLFLAIAGSSSNIMQLRYIDVNGFEKIRVDRDKYDSKPFLVSQSRLQNKSHRYYFKDVIRKKNNEFWYSKIDLNIERGEIEKPIKPVLRVGTPIFKEDEKVGILIINIFMKELLEEFSKASLYDIYLIDKDGDFIAHPDSEQCWNKYLKNTYNIKNQFSSIAEKILANDRYKDKEIYTEKLNFSNNDLLKIIIKPKLFYMENRINKQFNDLLIVMFSVLILSIPFAFLFSKEPIRLKEELEQLNEQLKQREKFSNTVIESNKNAIIAINEKQLVTIFNKSAEEMFGYSKHEMLKKKSLHNIIPMHFIKQHKKSSSHFMTTKESVGVVGSRVELEGKHKDGRIFPIRISFGVEFEGDKIIVIANIEDITKDKKQQKEIRERDRLLQQQTKLAAMGEMIGSIAHQWRQPLNSLNVNIENLEFDYEDGLIDKEFLDKFIVHQTDTLQYMSKTIDNFRNFFRIDKQKANFSVKKAIENSINIQMSELNKHGISLSVHGEDIIINSFENEFQQAVMNLISNAKDAIIQSKQKDGAIDISLTDGKIIIRDNGGGIPAASIERIFEPYYTTKEQGKGTGMGLYMSKMIIENNMGGKISVLNSGDGACFIIDMERAYDIA